MFEDVGSQRVFEWYNDKMEGDAYFKLFQPNNTQYHAPEEPETTCACDCSLKMFAAGAAIGVMLACLFTGMGAFDSV